MICLDASKASKIYEYYSSKNYKKYKFDCNEICYKENIYLCYNFTNCPSEYKNLIQEKKLCVKKCDLDDLYKYEYNNKCFKKCPPKTNILIIFAINFYALFIIIMNNMGASMKYHKDFI